jgi:hypothetical protein
MLVFMFPALSGLLEVVTERNTVQIKDTQKQVQVDLFFIL